MFWGIEISKVPVKVTPAFDLHITTACLSAVAKDTGRNVIQVKYDGKTYSLCSLKLGGIEHSTLDTIFEEGKEIEFSVSGNNTICLTGYFVDSMFGEDEEGNEEDDDEEEEGEEDEDEEMEGEDEDDEEEDEEEEDEEDDEDDEVEAALEQQILEQALKRKAQIEADKNKQQKKPKQEEPVKQTTPVKQQTPPAKPATPVTAKQTTPTKPATNAVAKQATPTKPVEAAAKPVAAEKKKPVSSIVTLPSGLQYEDIVVGSGPSPKSGKKVSVKYIGKLTNGKTFDSSLRTPFSFRIGIREVIRGWDIGVASMKVGGKRRLTIPSDLAYGKSGAPPTIPPNATLIFDVELVSCAQ
ncbi:hypothetical protein RB653_000729 [Dictyostelium firmibasis]|uniref:peptidylprolyl isomerase n=1 Tax=Dictyostelium firmibasis TaxID=79012 RepID=A0AAN7U390_9MYCE